LTSLPPPGRTSQLGALLPLVSAASTSAPHPAPIQLRAAAAVVLSAFLVHVRGSEGEAGREDEAGREGEAGRELLAAVLSDDAPGGQQGQQQEGQEGQPAKRDAQLFSLAAAIAQYRKQHGVEQPAADDEMPQAAG
jgi:hypothetical protein